jgi:D-aminoacyl-tRNA deacylase
MKIMLVNSRQDKAGVNIRRHLTEMIPGLGDRPIPLAAHQIFLTECEERLIYADYFDTGRDADLILFLSRHSSENPIPVLTTHVTGNFREAALGGRPGSLAPAAPATMQAILRALKRNAPARFRVSYEVTHHGPTELSTPSCFVEIGSTEKEWVDADAARAVARSVFEMLSTLPGDAVPMIGFGGTHYATRETEIALSSRGAFGHIAHTRDVLSLDRETIRLMAERTGAVAAYIDRKAIAAPEAARLTGILTGLGIPVMSEGEIGRLGSLPWECYRHISRLAETLVPDARIHLHRLDGTGVPVTFDCNPALIEEALKADADAFFAAVDVLPVVHLTTPKSRVLPIFITYEANRDKLINALITLCVKLIREKKTTAVERDHLIIREVRFDPEKARNLGLSRGPLFSRLAGGRPVEHEGRMITPEMVQSCREKRVHIPGLERYQ